MSPNEKKLIGQWRQVAPSTEPEQIFIEFQRDGHLTYTIESQTTQKIFLTWYVSDDEIYTDQPSAPGVESTRFRFESPLRLVLERSDGSYVYERV